MLSEEHKIQSVFIKMLDRSNIWYKHPCHAVPNGGLRKPSTGAILKREGVRAGVPDFFLPVARDGYHGLYIEFKTPKGKLTDSQKHMIPMLKSEGYRVEIMRDSQEAFELVMDYLNGEK